MKILVPVDGSAYSLKALEKACELAKLKTPSDLVILSASPTAMGELEEGQYIAEKLKRQAELALDSAKAAAAQYGCSPKLIMASGPSAADEIVNAAKQEKVDLIVIGSRGLAAKTRFFLGGTATHVVTYAPCSVLVVRTPD